MQGKRTLKRVFAMMLSAMLIVNMTAISAAEELKVPALCVHHSIHTVECGYAEAVTGAECTHEHTAECYITEGTDLPPESAVPPAEDTASGNDAVTGTNGMESSEDIAAIIQEAEDESSQRLDCRHVHDEQCGYAEAVEGVPCGYICDICGQQQAALPVEPVTVPSGRAAGESTYFFAWVLDENGKELVNPQYEPGLIDPSMAGYPSHTKLKYGAGIIQIQRSLSDTYNYFQYGLDKTYKGYNQGFLKLTEKGSIVKVFLARADGSGETRIEVITPESSQYPQDPMNPAKLPSREVTIHGRVLGNGLPVPGAEVMIAHMEHGSLTKTVYTDEAGNYTLKIAESWFGTAAVTARKQGFKIDDIYRNSFSYWDPQKSYDFTAVPLEGETGKLLLGEITGPAPASEVSIKISADGVESRTVKPNNSKEFEIQLEEAVYASKMILIKPEARGYRFSPSYKEISYDSYEAGTLLTFASENDSGKQLWMSVTDQNNKDLPQVTLTIQTGDSKELAETNTNGQAMVNLYDSYYLNRFITVIPSKAGYSFEPAYQSLDFSQGVTSFDLEFKGKTAQTSKTLSVIVMDSAGKPLSGIPVLLSVKTPRTVLTNGKGISEFSGLTEEQFEETGAEVSCKVTGKTYPVQTVKFETLGAAALVPGEAEEDNDRTCLVEVSADPSAGGTVSGGGSYPEGTSVTLRAQPSTGYRFEGWRKGGVILSADAEYQFKAVPGTMTFTAVFIKKEASGSCKVTFQTNGGSEINSQFVNKGGKITQPEATVKEGVQFLAWYSDEALSQKWNFNSDIVEEDLTLYAKWGYIFDADITVDEIPSITYTGTAVKPELKVWDGDSLLKINVDYTVSYNNNIKAGGNPAPSVTIKGKGNYKNKETTKVNFNILPFNLIAEDIVTVTGREYYTVPAKKAVKPDIKVSFGKKNLSVNKDYTLTCYRGTEIAESNKVAEVREEGIYTVVLTGINNFTGVRTRLIHVFDSNKKLMEKTSVKLKKENTAGKYTYTGAQIRPEIESVTLSGVKLAEGTDYTVTYGSNKEVGTGTVIIRAAKGSTVYAGEKTVTFQISGIPISRAAIDKESFITAPVYTGKPITQDRLVLFIMNGKGADAERINLERDRDYTVSYDKNTNINAGKGIMLITGKGNYAGTIKKSYTIVKADMGSSKQLSQFTVTSQSAQAGVPQNRAGAVLDDLQVSFTPKDIFTGEEMPAVTLKEGIDFTVSYQNNKNTGEKKASVSITGKGNYSGKIKNAKYFTITPKNLAGKDITVVVKNSLFKGKKEYKPVVTVYDNGKKLSNNKDIRIKDYSGNTELTEAASVTIEACGNGDYTGIREQTFRIYAKEITRAKIVLEETKTFYDGKQKTPAIKSITIGGITLSGDQYTVDYGRNKEKGTGTVTVTGTGEYGGSKTVKFLILPKWLRSFLT